jgi:hypothetical protein
MYNLNYTPTTLRVRIWREITSGGMWRKRVEYHYCKGFIRINIVAVSNYDSSVVAEKAFDVYIQN